MSDFLARNHELSHIPIFFVRRSFELVSNYNFLGILTYWCLWRSYNLRSEKWWREMLWSDNDKKQQYKIASPHKYKIQVKENTNSRKIKLKVNLRILTGKKEPSNKTPVDTKGMKMDIWVIGTSNNLKMILLFFEKGFHFSEYLFQC